MKVSLNRHAGVPQPYNAERLLFNSSEEAYLNSIFPLEKNVLSNETKDFSMLSGLVMSTDKILTFQ